MSAKQLVYKIEHSLTLPDGRILSAEVLKRVTPGVYTGAFGYRYPEEVELGDYLYTIGGVEIDGCEFNRIAAEGFGSEISFWSNSDEIETLVEPE